MDYSSFISKLIIVPSDKTITKGSIVVTSAKAYNKPANFEFGYVVSIDDDRYEITWIKNFKVVETKVERAIKVLNAYESAKFHYKSTKLNGDIWKYSYDILTYILTNEFKSNVDFKVEPETLKKKCSVGDKVTVIDGIYVFKSKITTIYGTLKRLLDEHYYEILLSDGKSITLSRSQFSIDEGDTFKLVKVLCPLCN